MKTPKTPIEFDYDLWTTEDGKCMVRVKITGEVTEVDRKVMRILRAEEKRLRRSKQGVPISGTEGKTAEERASVLSLSYVSYEGCEDLEPYWLIDSSSMEESVMFWMSEKEFRATLTPKQLDIYLNCIIGGQSKIDYAAANNMQRQSVYNAAMHSAAHSGRWCGGPAAAVRFKQRPKLVSYIRFNHHGVVLCCPL